MNLNYLSLAGVIGILTVSLFIISSGNQGCAMTGYRLANQGAFALIPMLFWTALFISLGLIIYLIIKQIYQEDQMNAKIKQKRR